MVKKFFGLIIFLLLSFYFLIPKTFAVEDIPAGEANFAISYDVLYDVGSDGITTITEKIILKNLTSQNFANQFKMTIGTTQVFDIKAFDGGGLLETTSEQKDTTTSISVKFNQQVVGLGKTLSWTLTFKSKDFAEKVGKVWEVRAPRISSSQSLEDYNFTLSVPQSFGEPTLISPIPKSQTISSGKMLLIFGKEQLQSSGISANFGNIQLFDFDLNYHLENNNLVSVLTNIALPPDTAYQDVIFKTIEPKPLNVTIDDDGNFLAWYRLSRGQKIDIKVIGSSKLYVRSKIKKPVLDEILKRKYVKSDKYWEKDNPQIIGKLEEILKGSSTKDIESKAKLIFQFVVNYLKYDPSRLKDNIERFGAVTALNNPTSAVCMEFTDLFIALSRAAGIPTRELNGYAYTANNTLRPLSLTTDILHAWPEYWNDKRGWVMVDPTWENTTGGVDYFNKLDLNHFVFAVKGLSSLGPAPAGSYKYSGQNNRDVNVTLSENDFLGKPQIDIETETSGQILSGFSNKIRVKISNSGNALFPSNILVLNADKLSVIPDKNIITGPIPSFGYGEFDFNLKTKSLFDSYNDQLVILVGDKKFTKDIKISPFILFQTIPLLIGIISMLMILIYLAVLGTHFYKRKSAKISK